jgi:hypothetical protein
MTNACDRPGREHAAPPPSVLAGSLEAPRRAALAVIANEETAVARSRAIEWLRARSPEQVVQALVADQVDQIFLAAAQGSTLVAQLPAGLGELLTARRRSIVVNVSRQEHVLGQASALLDEIGVGHVVFKGALVRQFLYAKPYLRPSEDVDLLVASDAAPRVSQALGQRGYSVTAAAHADTHEVSLAKNGVLLDVHWSILRPGRMRVDLTAEILAQRVRRGDLWGPNDVHLAVVMLVHPAISDHVTARLISAVDLDRWLRSREIPWDGVVEVLDRIGLRTAAWTMLRWTHALFDTPVPEEVWRALAPGPLRQRYLEAWLARHPGALYWKHPHLVRGAFSLALQDRVSDAARALWKLARKDRLSLGS